MNLPENAGSPLHGIRVIDLSSVMFGPYASQYLGDFGAEVIKVEAPAGDSTRRTGASRAADMAATFLGLNRNKRSIVLDLKQAPGREALQRLLENADVLMHNIRPQKLAALGLDTATLNERYPRLVCASLNGFGEGGPYAGQPAYDDIIQGMSGLVDLVQRQTGESRYLPTAAADKIAGLVAAQAILAALLGRAQSGRGGSVEVPMFEVLSSFSLVEHLAGQTFQPALGGTGYSRVLSPDRRPYRTRDGHLCVMPYTNEHWARFFMEIGRPELATDPRFTGMDARTRHIDELYALLAEFLAQRSTEEWVAACARIDIPAARVNSLDDLLVDPHLDAVGFFQELPRGDGQGAVRLPGTGVRFDGQSRPFSAPPRLGEHTCAVLEAVGFKEQEIAALLACGAARQAD
ncbi:CoA transferase [Pseudomonas sp. LS44]|uniref:CaiB/BaiF CoA transferase family protein n=1 Tax=Pseudomonas sp. LS44 TaxID=1357074 RepID=UPI00215AA4CE|nr:CoA transferase [Pseudomonas sp. LS44]UVE18702.1 CoA transferase [Pseudomonas sp. LS44]